MTSNVTNPSRDWAWGYTGLKMWLTAHEKMFEFFLDYQGIQICLHLGGWVLENKPDKHEENVKE